MYQNRIQYTNHKKYYSKYPTDYISHMYLFIHG